MSSFVVPKLAGASLPENSMRLHFVKWPVAIDTQDEHGLPSDQPVLPHGQAAMQTCQALLPGRTLAKALYIRVVKNCS